MELNGFAGAYQIPRSCRSSFNEFRKLVDNKLEQLTSVGLVKKFISPQIVELEKAKYPELNGLTKTLNNAHDTSIRIFDYLIENLFELFKDSDTATLVCESNYTEKNYLEEYAYNFSRSFKDYDRKCFRVHIFSCSITEIEFQDIIVARDTNRLDEIYQGYIVLKPIPGPVIGITCIKNEMFKSSIQDHFCNGLKRTVNLFGNKLEIATTPFQEQDRVTSACATSALWVSLNSTGKIFHHKIPSTVEITKFATDTYPHTERTFPNRGLSVIQSIMAINKAGIGHICNRITVNKPKDLVLGKIASYIEYGIPCAMFGMIISKEQISNKIANEDKSISYNDLLQSEDKLELVCREIAEQNSGQNLHAITAVGVRYGNEHKNVNVKPYENINVSTSEQPKLETLRTANVSFKSHKIESLWVHDDQIGPFCNLKLLTQNDLILFEMPKNKIFVLQHFIIPCYHKIRVPFAEAYGIAISLNKLIVTASTSLGLYDGLEWQISLSDTNKFKNELSDMFEANKINPEERFEYLATQLPKYVWDISLLYQGEKTMSFIIDATSNHTENSCVQLIASKEKSMLELIKTFILAEEETIRKYFIDSQISKIVDKIIGD